MLHRAWPWRRATLYGSLSGLIVPLALAVWIVVSTPRGWGSMGAAMILVAAPLFALLVGLPVSALLCLLVFVPVAATVGQRAMLTLGALVVAGAGAGLCMAELLDAIRASEVGLELPLVLWGGLGGLLFFLGARSDV